MEVTIVDSEPSVVALIDYLDSLPTQPPSLYLDIEGVNLSRHGSISILQLLVLPKSHIFLIDIFVLQEKAFYTSNTSGTNLQSILESALVPKVFFDVRNDADALFAHFQISMQGIYDVQLLEVATRTHSKDRVFGLARCVEMDAQLPVEDIAVWKAAKQKGVSLFAPEHGGSYEVFNSRPMLQDIVDYCMQDVVYLPVLWMLYTQKISTKWIRKVQDETRERLRASQTAAYEPRGKNKKLSPWANPAKFEKGNGPSNAETKTTTTVSQKVATETAKKSEATQPDAKPHSQPFVGEADSRWSARLAVLEAPKKTPEVIAEVERPSSKIDLPFRSKNELEGRLHRNTGLTLYPDTVHSKWTCTACRREMQNGQKEEHLAGKQHISRVKRAATAASEATPQTGTARVETLPAMTVTVTNPQVGRFPIKAKHRQANPGKAEEIGTKGRKRQAAAPNPQQRGLPYPPDHLFSGFEALGGSRGHGNSEYERAFSTENVNYGLCNKDCGWCGHCMDNADF